MAAEVDAEPLPRRRAVVSEPAARELLKNGRTDPRRGAARRARGHGVVRANAAPAARVRAGHRHSRRGDLHGQGPAAARQPQGARLGRPAVGRLRHGRLRRGRRGAGDRLRPCRAVARDLEPAPGQARHHHRLGAGRDGRLLHAGVRLVGDIYHVLARLGEECRHVPHEGGSAKLREVVLGHFEQAGDDDSSDAAAACPLGDAPRSGARTSWSRASACTSSGSGVCSRPTSRTPC